MTSKRFLLNSFLATVLIALAACNSNDGTTATDADGSDTAATTAEPVAASTVTRTPQGMFLAKHRVADFSKWLASYEAHDSMRLANGLHSYVIGRGVQDTNMVLVVVKADDMAKAKSFSKDASLKKAMQAGGVRGTPTFFHLNATYQDTAVLSDVIRAMSSFNVKDWANWQKGFEDGRSERIENGIADRAYGNDPENPNKVVVVTAAVDSSKATAYWNSDMLKKRREAGGVIGSPDRFLFRIVKRY